MKTLPFAQPAVLVEVPPHRRLWPALTEEPDAALERTRLRAVRNLQMLEDRGPDGNFAADLHAEWTALLATVESALSARNR